jgi:hypothetical protein
MHALATGDRMVWPCPLTRGAAVYVGCKTRPTFGQETDSALATIEQLVRFCVDFRARGAALDPTRAAAVLTIAENAPRSTHVL